MLEPTTEDRVQLLRVAHAVAVAAKKRIPADVFAYALMRGSKDFTPNDADKLIADMAYIIDRWVSCDIIGEPGPLAEAISLVADSGWDIPVRCSTFSDENKAACAFRSTTFTFRHGNPYNEHGPHSYGSALSYLSSSIWEAHRGGVELALTVGPLLGLTADTWPVFITLLCDGRDLYDCVEAAKLVS